MTRLYICRAHRPSDPACPAGHGSPPCLPCCVRYRRVHRPLPYIDPACLEETSPPQVLKPRTSKMCGVCSGEKDASRQDALKCGYKSFLERPLGTQDRCDFLTPHIINVRGFITDGVGGSVPPARYLWLFFTSSPPCLPRCARQGRTYRPKATAMNPTKVTKRMTMRVLTTTLHSVRFT